MKKGRLVGHSAVRRRLALCGAALLLLTVVWLTVLFRIPELLTVCVLDVGQGDAVLVCCAGETLLVDAGPNAAEYHLLAELRAMGIRRLDAMVLTHPDEDHIGGADVILEAIPVEKIYLPALEGEDETFSRFLEAVALSGAAISVAGAGERFELGAAEVHFLAPLSLQGASNDSSAVLRISCGKTAVLLMGDAEAAAEELLLQRYSAECLSADLLKAGHHGASTSTSDALLDAVSPRFVAVSCGYGNTFGHPARRVVDALAARGIAVGRTDREGTLIYCSDGKRLWRKQ